MIEKIQLDETDLIVGNNFPEYDEDAYRRESQSHVDAAEKAAQARNAAQNAADYTTAEFQGMTADEMSEAMRLKIVDLTISEDRHTAVAGLLVSASENIVAAKTEMNNAQLAYHEKMSQAFSSAGDEGWYQGQLNEVRTELVREGQERVSMARESFDSKHTSLVNSIADALVNGSASIQQNSAGIG